MTYKRILLTLIAVLATLLPSVAQDDPRAQLSRMAQAVQNNARQTQMLAQQAQSYGAPPSYFQQLQAEMQLHQTMYAYLEQLYQDPTPLYQPGGVQRYKAVVDEYTYRYTHGDYRPYEQIAGNIQANTQYNEWRYNTPQGLAAQQADLQARNAAFQNQQAAHRSAVNAFDNSQAAIRAASNQADKYHTQYVEGIHDRTRWVNPNNGNEYSIDNSVQQPMVQNWDGTYSPMVQYQNW